MSAAIRYVYDDGGRAAAGYKGHTTDCSCRAVAIATGQPYQMVYDALNALGKRERGRPGGARTGVKTATLRKYLASLGWRWVPTMHIGSGCTRHLLAEELPAGRIIARVSGHVCAVLDGVIHDIYDPSRGGTRCVYGYWRQAE